MAKDKVMHPGSPPAKRGLKHTGGGKVKGPTTTQLNPFNKGKKK